MSVEKRKYTGSARDVFDMTRALNAELSVEECGFELDEEHKAGYERDLKWLKDQRAENPGVPIAYDVKYSYLD